VHQAAGNAHGVDGRIGAKAREDREAGLMHVVPLNRLVGEWPGDRDWTVEVIGVGGTEGRNGKPSLGKAGGELGMRVDDAPDARKLAIEQRVGVEVRGRTKRTAHDLAVEIGDNHVPGAELVIGDAGRFDDDQPLLPVDAGSIAEGVQDKSATDQFEIGFKDFFAKALQVHWVTPRKRRSRSFAALRMTTLVVDNKTFHTCGG
jgi:hypothetical protein